MAASASGVFVGVAVSTVRGLAELKNVVPEVNGVPALLGSDFEGEPLLSGASQLLARLGRRAPRPWLLGNPLLLN